MAPTYILYNGHIWQMGYSTFFGNGYLKLTAKMHKHPSQKWMGTMQVIKMLMSGKCDVAIDPKPTDEIIDTMPYQEWLKNNHSKNI